MAVKFGVTYIHTDHLGSTSITSGVQSGDSKYFPYGATRSGAVSTAYKFTSQRLDDSTGLYYYGARYYDAVIGRFIQADIIVPDPSNPQDLNRCTYVRNNPLKLIDRTGYFSEEAIIDYLKRTYGENWESKLAEWKANVIWWRTLREARPGDVLIVADEEGKQLYGCIVGQLGENAEQDILLGLEQIQDIGRTLEEDKILGEQQDVGLWSKKELLGLARYEHQRLTLKYWDSVSNKWGMLPFLNLPLIHRPQFGQTIHPIGKGLIGGFGAVAIAEVYATGVEALAAGPIGIPVTIILWAGGTYILLSWYNIIVTPTSP